MKPIPTRTGNVRISNQNHSTEPAAWFTQSVISLGYDYSFSELTRLIYTSFAFEETSALLGKEIYDYYKNISRIIILKQDLPTSWASSAMKATTPSISEPTKYERLKAGRIRYVKQGGTGKGNLLG